MRIQVTNLNSLKEINFYNLPSRVHSSFVIAIIVNPSTSPEESS